MQDIQSTPERCKAEEVQRRAFTSNKLDWMSGVMSDPRLSARDFEVGFCIAQHLNEQTLRAFPADETISDKTGIAKRWILRSRKALKEAGWLDWKRTGRSNVYWLLDGNLNAVVDHQIMLREAREERRKAHRTARRVAPSAAYRKVADLPSVADHVVPSMAVRDVPPVANKHLSSYTFDTTRSKILPSIEEPLEAVPHPQLAETRLIEELGEGDTERGLTVAQSIGQARFSFLLGEFQAGRLYPSAIRSASAPHQWDIREVAA